jgi:hypothetical protein
MTEHHGNTLAADHDALLGQLSGRAAIQDLIAAYGLGQDLHQDGDNDVLTEWDQVFAPDARVDYTAAGAPADLPYKELAALMRGPEGSMGDLIRWQHCWPSACARYHAGHRPPSVTATPTCLGTLRITRRCLRVIRRRAIAPLSP